MSKMSSLPRNLSKLIEARLQAELSKCIYSLHGLEPLMRPVFEAVCHLLTVVSYCMPGSAHSQAAWEIWRISSRAGMVLTVLPFLTALSAQSVPFSTAFIKSSVTRTELLAF